MKVSSGQGAAGSSEKLKDHRQLNVRQKSHTPCLHMYEGVKRFFKDEQYYFTSLIRRSAVFISRDTAQGYGRKTAIEYARFLYIAYGSVCELETRDITSAELGYLKEKRL